MKTSCKACTKGKDYYVNNKRIKLCTTHLKFFKNVHGEGVETEVEYKERNFFTGKKLKKLAKAMLRPLKFPLDYVGIARKLIKVEPLKNLNPVIYDQSI